jgi:hypothetical protein
MLRDDLLLGTKLAQPRLRAAPDHRTLGWYRQAGATWRAQGDPAGKSRALRGQALVYLDTVRPAGGWHGLIRHVQSDAERYFTQWSDAMAFISQFVAVEAPPHDA